MPWLGVWIGVAYWNALAATRGAGHGINPGGHRRPRAFSQRVLELFRR